MSDTVRVLGDAFSHFYLDRGLPDEKALKRYLAVERDELRDARALVRDARRTLASRVTAASTESALLRPLGQLLGWHVGSETAIETTQGREAGGIALLDARGAIWARGFAAAPDTGIDDPPPGRHRRFSLAATIARILETSGTPYAIACNARELRFVRRAEGQLTSALVFDLGALVEHGVAVDRAWALLFGLLRQQSIDASPRVLDEVVRLGRFEMVQAGKTLGKQVREAIVHFVRGLYDDPENRAQLPAADDEAGLARLYGEVLRVLYRCLFALYAEARNLVPIDLPIYRESYALRGTYPTTGLAARLRATFRLLQRGADLGNGEAVPAFAGSLFSDEAAPLVDALRWSDLAVAKMLAELTHVESKRGRVPVSYRELDVEQLGSIYEGLLELTLALASEPLERINLDGRELVVDRVQLAVLQQSAMPAAREPESAANDDDEFDADEDEEDDEPEDAEPAPRARVKRHKLRGVGTLAAGQPYLKTWLGRKESASYYTARDLVDFLVRETIDPLATNAEPQAILALRIVDPAMGSGHFLIGAARRLALHLLAAYRRIAARDGEETLPAALQRAWDDESESLTLCRQLVAVHCLYGVDKNPLAVDLARVALWLATAAAGHPLSFLDHRLRCGDSLLWLPVERVVSLGDLKTAARKHGRKNGTQFELLQTEGALANEIELQAAVDRTLSAAFDRLGDFLAVVDDEREPFEAKRAASDRVRATLEPLFTLHDARVGRLLNADARVGPLLDAFATFARTGAVEGPAADGVASWIESGNTINPFAWELEFPEVFFARDALGQTRRRPDAGFDVVLGNPPWDKLKIDRKSFYVRYDPLLLDYQGRTADVRIAAIDAGFKNTSATFVRALETTTRYVRALSESGFVWQAVMVDGSRTGGDPDCFKYFTELSYRLTRSGGAVGLVLPGAFTSGDGTTGLRRMVLDHARLRTLFVFENRRKLFEIDSRMKFQVMTYAKGGATDTFEGAFWQHGTDLLRLPRHERANGTMSVRTEAVRRGSPERLAILEVRGERDLRIAQQLLAVAPPLGDARRDGWGASFGRELDMSNDRKLFRTRRELETTGIIGAGQLPDGETLWGRGGERYVPLREGRMVQAFDANAKRYVSGEARSALWDENGWPKRSIEPHYWVRWDEISADLRRETPRVYWCDVSGATNERTAMAALAPGFSIGTESLRAIYLPDDALDTYAVILAVFNSFIFDWYMRMLVAQHLSNHFVEPAPFARKVPHAHLVELVNLVSSETVDYVSRADARAELDAAVALAYELSYGDFVHIIDTFYVAKKARLDRLEPAIDGEIQSTLTKDLALAAYCRLAAIHDAEHADRVRAARSVGAYGYVANPLRQKIAQSASPLLALAKVIA